MQIEQSALKSDPVPTDRPARILICAVQIPFVKGGAERHIENLRSELVRAGNDVDVVRLPLKWYPPRQLINDAMAWRFLDLTHFYGLPVDMVISTRFPSYAIRHPRKIAWVLHQHRQAYDLLNTDFTDFDATVEHDEVRRLIYKLDKKSLLECRSIYTNSRNVSHRMNKYLGVPSEPLYHPPPLTGRYECLGYEDYIFTAGRLELNKRIDLLLRSLAKTCNPIRVVIAGDGPQKEVLQQLAADLGIGERVTFAGYVDDDVLLGHYANCGAVYYAPLDEDYGYVTLEAFSSKKPVITSSDSGGVLEFVKHEHTGYIGEPDPGSLAKQMDVWFASGDCGRKFGEEGFRVVKDISWDDVVRELTQWLWKS